MKIFVTSHLLFRISKDNDTIYASVFNVIRPRT